MSTHPVCSTSSPTLKRSANSASKLTHRPVRTEPCFVCSVVDGDARLPKNIIYEDEGAIVFLDGYPRAYGYTLVAPKKHREQVTGYFTMEEYIDLHQLVNRVSEAISEDVGAERMYIYSLGSNQSNSHAHWHGVPLPPGVPYEEQQGAWASWSKGVLRIPHEELDSLAERIGQRIGRINPA